MYLNEAFIIGCMSSRPNNKVLTTVYVIIISYILAVFLKKYAYEEKKL